MEQSMQSITGSLQLDNNLLIQPFNAYTGIIIKEREISVAVTKYS